MTSRSHPHLLLAPVLALALCACGENRAAPPPSAPAVAVAEVRITDLVERIEATGQLLAKDRARIAAEVVGRVTEIVTDEGLPVEAGGVVLKIDPERRELELRSAEARLAEARAARSKAHREVGRVRKLSKRNVASPTQLDDAETAYSLARSRLEAAQAQLGVARRALRDASVQAPFAGLVAQRLVSPGEFVAMGQPLFELVALDPIEVEFHLAEVDSSRVALGNEVRLSVSPYPEEVFHARVTFVSPTIDSRTRTLRVKAITPNEDGRLRPGLFARIDLGVSTRSDALMVPEEAVLRRAQGDVLFVLKGDRVERRLVETGSFAEGEIEIRRGVAPDEIVVQRGHGELADGARVTVRDLDGSLPNPAVADGPGGPENAE
jgi:membrane fusion protein (multidrug efflux system)